MTLFTILFNSSKLSRLQEISFVAVKLNPYSIRFWKNKTNKRNNR